MKSLSLRLSANVTLPPCTSTRATSEMQRSWSGTSPSTRTSSTALNDASGKGKEEASPWVKRIFAKSDNLCRAISSISGCRSNNTNEPSGTAPAIAWLKYPGPQPISSTASVDARAIRSTVRVGDWISRRRGFRSELARFAGKIFPRPRPKVLVTGRRHSRASSPSANAAALDSLGCFELGRRTLVPQSFQSASLPPYPLGFNLLFSYSGPHATRSQPPITLRTPNVNFTVASQDRDGQPMADRPRPDIKLRRDMWS